MRMNCYRPLHDASKVLCSFDFTNTGTRDLYLLKRDTPLEGLSSPFLSLSFEGHSMEYEGTIVHRTKVPEKDEFVLLRTGQTLSAAAVDITEAFSIYRDGLYTIKYNRPLHYVHARWGGRFPLWFSRTITQDVSGEDFNIPQAFPIYLESTYLLKKPPTNNNEDQMTYAKDVVTEICGNAKIKGGTAEQRKTVCDIHKVIVGRMINANDSVGNNTLTKTYFGVYDEQRYDTVKKNFEKMADGVSGLTNTTISYDLTCKRDWVAYVTNKKTPVYLCKKFWGKIFSRVSCKGLSKESKEGTIVHEWSHIYAKTTDVVYGAKQSRELAKKKPSDAIKNADSYETFYCLAQK